MFRIKLSFCSGDTVELLRVDCVNVEGDQRTSIRGKSAGAYRGAGTFQWSSAVRGMACLFLRAKMLDEDIRLEPMLSGGAHSIAASLDYALTKQPGWLVEMFGSYPSGKAQARRLFNVTNSHQKRGGPVSISLNSHVCPKRCIEVVLNGCSVDSPALLQTMLDSIETYQEAPQVLPETSAVQVQMVE